MQNDVERISIRRIEWIDVVKIILEVKLYYYNKIKF